MVLAEPFAQGVAMQQNALARVPKITLAPKLVHVMRHDFARGSHILRKQLVRERNHLHGTVFVLMTQAFREADQRTREAAGDIINRETLDAASEIHRPLDEELKKSDRKLRTARGKLFDFRGRPSHHLRVFERDRNLRALRQTKEG